MSEDHADSLPRTRRRNRTITSCLECRRRKLKCERIHPCIQCTKGNRDCVFLARDPASKGKLNQFKQSLETLEKGLETTFQEDNTATFVANPSPGDIRRLNAKSAHDLQDPEDERNLEPTRLAFADVAYDDDGEDLGDDLGVRFGRMRITERIGGYARPRLADEFAEIVRLQDQKENRTATLLSPPSSDERHEAGGLPSYFNPSATYVAPATGLLFSGFTPDEISLLTFLPQRHLADSLLQQYWRAVHPIAHLVHKQSFERQYELFWNTINSGYEPQNSVQALVFAVLFSGAVSLPVTSSAQDFGQKWIDVVRPMQAGCEFALSKSHLLRTTKVDVLQSFVIYLIPMCRAEFSRSHGALTSTAIRLATMAGLHKDGSNYGLPPVDIHLRRLIWHHLCFLDIRSLDAMGPPFQIRNEDFDTRLPLNVDDEDFGGLMPVDRDRDRWTDVTFTKIKFECVSHRRKTVTGIARLRKKETTITTLLRETEDFRRAMEKHYKSLIDETVPIQLMGMRLINLYADKSIVHIMALYVVFAPQRLPERLQDVVWSAGIALSELVIEMETSPRFRDWAWYSGAYHQWHIALLLFAEIMQHNERPEVDRIWRILDYVWELPEGMSNKEKAAYVVHTASSRVEQYKRQRRAVMPLELQRTLGPSSENETKRARHSSSETQRPPSFQPLLQGFNRKSSQGSSAVSSPTPDWQTGVPKPANPSVGMPQYLQADLSLALNQNVRQPNEPSEIQASPYSLFTNPSPVAFPSQDSGQQDFTSLEGMDIDWDEIERLFPYQANPPQMPAQYANETQAETTTDFHLPYYTFFTPPHT